MEENTRYSVLKFPVYQGITWNGNQFNSLGFQEYHYANVDTTVMVNGRTFEHCVVVMESTQADSTSIINYRKAYTVYAPDIGKIKKYVRVYVCDNSGANCFNPDKSYTHIEHLVDYN